MSDYKHGDWFCRPETEAEAAEIVRLAIASGADNEGDYEGDSVVAYGVKDGKVDMYHSKGTEYTLTQLRAMFGANKWNGEGLPPVGAVCEFRETKNENPGPFDDWTECTLLAINKSRAGDDQFIIRDHRGDAAILYSDSGVEFRPLRTKRDKWIENALSLDCEPADGMLSRREFCGKLYDAGLAKDIEE